MGEIFGWIFIVIFALYPVLSLLQPWFSAKELERKEHK